MRLAGSMRPAPPGVEQDEHGDSRVAFGGKAVGTENALWGKIGFRTSARMRSTRSRNCAGREQ